MPKPSSRKRAASEDYASDGGFIEDAPKTKKSKAAAAGSSDSKGQDSGAEYWELGRTRRVQINEFKGKQLVDIREFYEKEGEMLPGRKGISLNIEQFQSFVEMLPEIEKALKAKGISMARPKYDGVESEGEEKGEDEEAEGKVDAASEDEEVSKPVKAGKLDKFKHRANFEATSDEDN